MKQFLFFLSTFFLLSFSAIAQRSIQSTVFDAKNGLTLEMGAVKLLHLPDSTLVQGSLTDSKGSFILNKVKPGNYAIVVSMVGYVNYKQSVIMANKDIILKNIQLQENAHLLKEVQVTGTAAQMVVKGDTMEYNATAFKTVQNAVVEDLLKRMPGIQVGSDGKITVNGQSITKIRVDGKKFFDGDIETATKNMPADMIDKVQVLDQKSDVALLTGFEDNNTERIINLTTKANRRKGVFGNLNGGVGLDLNDDVRYDGNGIVSIMNGDTQTAILGGGNNINNARSGRSRGGLGSPSGGITQTQNLGANNNTTVNSNLKIGGDASFNHSTNESITENNTTSYLSGSSFTNHSFNNSTPENYAANLRLEAEWKPDTLNTIVLQPNIGYNRAFSNSSNRYSYLTDKDTTTVGNSSNIGNTTSLNANLNVIYSHRFTSKKGRTLTANFQTGISQSNGDGYNISNKTTANVLTSVNQYTKNNSDQYNFGLNLSYVEPLWNVKNLLQTSLSARMSNSSSEKNQFNKDPFDNDYTLKDSAYSNSFDNYFYTESLELSYKHVEKLWNVTLGGKVEPSQTISNTVYGDGTKADVPTLSVVNFAPTMRFQYNFNKKKFMRADYTGRTSQPSISQLQPVRNNSNQMNETVGNPDLNPSFSHNLRLMYSAFNDITFSSFNTFLNVQATKDALVMNSIYDETGKQYSQTVNAGSVPYSINGMIMFNTPIIAKTLHLMTSTSLGLDQRYGYSSKNMKSQTIDTNNLIKGDLSDTHQYSAGEMLSLTLTQDVFEIGVKGNFQYSNTLNNLNPVTQITKKWTATGNILFHLPYDINISSDLNYSTLQGFSTNDQKYLIWNGTIDKTIFKSKKGVIAFKMIDILHQQLNYQQSIGDNSITYSKFNTLPSYFIVSFAYKIADFGGNKNRNEPGRDFQRFGPPDGGDHPHRDRGNDGGGGGFGRPQF
jgi:hypothetical protein